MIIVSSVKPAMSVIGEINLSYQRINSSVLFGSLNRAILLFIYRRPFRNASVVIRETNERVE
jgi:hypothetical protein